MTRGGATLGRAFATPAGLRRPGLRACGSPSPICATREVSYFLKGRRRLRAVLESNAEERFDLVSEDNQPLGRSKARSKVHRDGDWHRAAHVWFVRGANASEERPSQILLQKRSASKDTFPGRWDVSAAGHISSGDASLTTALREVEEELGITLAGESKLDFCFTARSENRGETALHGSFFDREFQDVYLVEWTSDDESQSWNVQAEEVDGVTWFDWREYQARLESGHREFVPRPVQYRAQFFQLLEERFSQ